MADASYHCCDVVFYDPSTDEKTERTKSFPRFTEKGDKIVTTGGIYGKVMEINDFTILMEVEGGVKLKVDKSAVIKDMTDATPSK